MTTSEITWILMDKPHSQKPTECFPLGQPPGSILLKEDNLLVTGFCKMQEEIYLKEGGPEQALKATV